MKLIFNEDQKMLWDTIEKFVQKHGDINFLRQYRDDRTLPGYSAEIWQQLAVLGFVGLAIPEAFGGSGLGFRELCLTFEALGSKLMTEPFLSTTVLGAKTLELFASDAQKQKWLPSIAEGNTIATFALLDDQSTVTYSEQDSKIILNGLQNHVPDAHLADLIIVTATNESKITKLLMIPTNNAGVNVTRQHWIDERNVAMLDFKNAPIESTDVIAEGNDVHQILETIKTLATVAISSEMLGAAQAAFDITLDYLKERVQFGVPIGSFQALQHRAAQMYIDLELARSAVIAAASATDQDPDKAPAYASLAKAKISETFELIAKEGVQMHGGVGVTDEYDIGFYLKRARASSAMFGSVDWHKSHWAELHKY